MQNAEEHHSNAVRRHTIGALGRATGRAHRILFKIL